MAASDKYEYVINSDGSIVRRRIIESDINAEGAISRAFSRNVKIKRPRAFSLENYPGVGITFTSDGLSVYTVPVETLSLRCEFAPVGSDVVIPVFNYAKGSKAVIGANWVVRNANDQLGQRPNVVLVCYISPNGSKFSVQNTYLYAFDGEGRAYRLPLPNVYEDCRLCSGDYNSLDETEVGSLKKALAQFESAAWNSDLDNLSHEGASDNFFRLHPEKEGFTTLSINAPNWTTLCTKVATELLEDVVL